MDAGSPRLRKISCPQCGGPSIWSADNPFRPFCSERCKLIDLGQWATGAYRIAQENADAGSSSPDDPQTE
jgi:endogenous inhibitor of DNA gyrase (YacG/DUF329 family)